MHIRFETGLQFFYKQSFGIFVTYKITMKSPKLYFAKKIKHTIKLSYMKIFNNFQMLELIF